MLTLIQVLEYNLFIHICLKVLARAVKKLEDPLFLGVFLAGSLFFSKAVFALGENDKNYLNLGGPVNNTETALLSQEGALFSKDYNEEGVTEETEEKIVLINEAEALGSVPIDTESDFRKIGSYKPNLAGYFKMPTNGFNSGALHNYNAVDIANACGAGIVAAADGVVIEENSGNWNGGYGSFIKIEHPNGTKTLYAHNSENLAATGDIVKQGEEIAKVGKTGNVSGPTGCHLHFEVHGAVNPFVK
ncbi:MAG: M23 family metallopeptidase [Candidatus Paceibacterota bacterium]